MVERISLSGSDFEIAPESEVASESEISNSRCPAVRAIGAQILHGSKISCPEYRDGYLKQYKDQMQRLEDIRSKEHCEVNGNPPGTDVVNVPPMGKGGCEFADQCPIYLESKGYIIHG